MRKPVSIQAPTSVTASGGLTDANVGVLTRILTFVLFLLASAGTNPTYAAKLQTSGPAVRGNQFISVGATSNKLKAGASTTVQLGAQFTQTGSKSISTISVMLDKIGTITAGKLVTVGIYTDSGGDPTTLLGSATIDIDSLVSTTYGYVTVTFASPIDLTDATVYHIVLSADYTASATNCVQWRSLTVASGGNFESYNATIWADTATESLEFYTQVRTYVDVVGGGFTGATSVASRQTINLPASSISEHVRLYGTIGGTSSPAFTVALDVIAESQQS